MLTVYDGGTMQLRGGLFRVQRKFARSRAADFVKQGVREVQISLVHSLEYVSKCPLAY